MFPDYCSLQTTCQISLASIFFKKHLNHFSFLILHYHQIQINNGFFGKTTDVFKGIIYRCKDSSLRSRDFYRKFSRAILEAQNFSTRKSLRGDLINLIFIDEKAKIPHPWSCEVPLSCFSPHLFAFDFVLQIIIHSYIADWEKQSIRNHKCQIYHLLAM